MPKTNEEFLIVGMLGTLALGGAIFWFLCLMDSIREIKESLNAIKKKLEIKEEGE
jgi:hypothetical protein